MCSEHCISPSVKGGPARRGKRPRAAANCLDCSVTAFSDVLRESAQAIPLPFQVVGQPITAPRMQPNTPMLKPSMVACSLGLVIFIFHLNQPGKSQNCSEQRASQAAHKAVRKNARISIW